MLPSPVLLCATFTLPVSLIKFLSFPSQDQQNTLWCAVDVLYGGKLAFTSISSEQTMQHKPTQVKTAMA